MNGFTDLFHQGISESGSALALWAKPQQENQLLIAQIQARFVGCNDIENSSVIIKCLREKDGNDLVESGDKFKV